MIITIRLQQIVISIAQLHYPRTNKNIVWKCAIEQGTTDILHLAVFALSNDLSTSAQLSPQWITAVQTSCSIPYVLSIMKPSFLHTHSLMLSTQ